MKKYGRIFSLIMIVTLMIINSLTVLGTTIDDLGSWETVTPMPTNRGFLGAAEVNGKIYVIGGLNSSDVNIVEEYDPSTNTWTTKANMPTARKDFGIAVVNDKIYVMGGHIGSSAPLNKVEEYDPSTNAWSTKASMNMARKGLGAVEVNGRIYAVGGYNYSNGVYLSTVEEYNPITNIWTTKADMITGRSDFGISTVNGKIYVIGGASHDVSTNTIFLDTVEEYNITEDQWISKTSMPIKARYFGISELNNKIYCMGGNTPNSPTILSSMLEYNPIDDTWNEKSNMLTARMALASVEYNGRIYAIGGKGNDGLNTVDVFTPPLEVNTPINLTATTSNQKIILNWNAVADIDSYTILRSTASGTINTVIASNITTTTYTDTNVTPGVTYYYVVRAVKNDVESTDSNIASAMIEENNNFANLQIKLSTTDINEYRMTMTDVDAFKNWYVDRSNGTGLPFYSFPDDANIEPYTVVNEYLIFDKIVWFKVKEYFK